MNPNQITMLIINSLLFGFFDQVFHSCQRDGRKSSFLCPNATLFDQKKLICNWWYEVSCIDADFDAGPPPDATSRVHPVSFGHRQAKSLELQQDQADAYEDQADTFDNFHSEYEPTTIGYEHPGLMEESYDQQDYEDGLDQHFGHENNDTGYGSTEPYVDDTYVTPSGLDLNEKEDYHSTGLSQTNDKTPTHARQKSFGTFDDNDPFGPLGTLNHDSKGRYNPRAPYNHPSSHVDIRYGTEGDKNDYLGRPDPGRRDKFGSSKSQHHAPIDYQSFQDELNANRPRSDSLRQTFDFETENNNFGSSNRKLGGKLVNNDDFNKNEDEHNFEKNGLINEKPDAYNSQKDRNNVENTFQEPNFGHANKQNHNNFGFEAQNNRPRGDQVPNYHSQIGSHRNHEVRNGNPNTGFRDEIRQQNFGHKFPNRFGPDGFHKYPPNQPFIRRRPPGMRPGRPNNGIHRNPASHFVGGWRGFANFNHRNRGQFGRNPNFNPNSVQYPTRVQVANHQPDNPYLPNTPEEFGPSFNQQEINRQHFDPTFGNHNDRFYPPLLKRANPFHRQNPRLRKGDNIRVYREPGTTSYLPVFLTSSRFQNKLPHFHSVRNKYMNIGPHYNRAEDNIKYEFLRIPPNQEYRSRESLEEATTEPEHEPATY